MGNASNTMSGLGAQLQQSDGVGGAAEVPDLAVSLTVCSDPWASGMWTLHPSLLVLTAEYGHRIEQVHFQPARPTVLSESHVQYNEIEKAVLCGPENQMRQFAQTPALPQTTVPALRALETVRAIAPARSFDYLYRLQESLYIDETQIDKPDLLVQTASDCDIDPDTFQTACQQTDPAETARLCNTPYIRLEIGETEATKEGVLSYADLEDQLTDWGLTPRDDPTYSKSTVYDQQTTARIRDLTSLPAPSPATEQC